MAALACAAMAAAGCATITNDPTVPISLSFSDGSSGECHLRNKRGNWTAEIPGTVQVRRSDDVLHYDCTNAAGLTAKGDIPSRMGGKIVASAVFPDFGIVDSTRPWRSPLGFAVTQAGGRVIRHGRGGFWSGLYSAPNAPTIPSRSNTPPASSAFRL